MAKLGRPALPVGEKLVHMSIRVPAWVRDELKKHGSASHAVRTIVEARLRDRT